jgi:flavin reductase (DIM6/NTAB) family NADH-FMN oxidoreductase RutF
VRMEKAQATARSCMQPASKVLVSCRGTDGRNNALAVAYACNCSYDPPMVMVGIVPSRHSYRMIKDTGCFVVNLVGTEQKAMFDYLGSHSGRDEDKLAKLGVRVAEGEKVKAPLLADCPVSIECSVVDSIVTGSHEMFVGKVEVVHAEKGLVQEDGSIDFGKIDFL